MAKRSTAAKSAAPVQPEGAVVSVETARRVVLYLLAFWTAIWGVSLIFGANSASLSAGIEEHSAQRLLGVHVLILAPLYGLIAWNLAKYRVFLWVPYVSQAAITVVTLLDLRNAVLPFVVAVIFLALLLFLWQASRKPAAAKPATAPSGGGATPPAKEAKRE